MDHKPRQNVPKEDFISCQIKVLQDETVEIIDSGDDVCCLGSTFQITKVVRSTQGGPLTYLQILFSQSLYKVLPPCLTFLESQDNYCLYFK